MKKNKLEELKQIIAVYEMACESLPPDSFEVFFNCLNQICKNRKIKSGLFSPYMIGEEK